MPEYLSSEGGPPVTDDNVPSQEDIERRERGARAIGYDPASGWGPGLSIAGMSNRGSDSFIYAQQRERWNNGALNAQQFGDDRDSGEAPAGGV
jgi:hypothetical protein